MGSILHTLAGRDWNWFFDTLGSIIKAMSKAQKLIEARPPNPKDYPVEIRPLAVDDGGGWLATFPDLPGCMGDGDTPEEAIADGYQAAQAWLSVAAECGDPIPKPSRGGESGRFVARVQLVVKNLVYAISYNFKCRLGYTSPTLQWRILSGPPFQTRLRRCSPSVCALRSTWPLGPIFAPDTHSPWEENFEQRLHHRQHGTAFATF